MEEKQRILAVANAFWDWWESFTDKDILTVEAMPLMLSNILPSFERQEILTKVKDGMHSIVAHMSFRAPAGSFMDCVIENNLMEAIKQADEWNQIMLFPYCYFIYNKAPLELARFWRGKSWDKAYLEMKEVIDVHGGAEKSG